MIWLAKLILFLPFVSFVIVLPFYKKISDKLAQATTCCLMVASFLCATIIFFTHLEANIIIAPWLSLENLQIDWGMKIDALSTTMMWLITFISTLVHVYSIGYMRKDGSIPRFMALLSFFTFAMLLLVSAPNLLQLFVGWEGVGVASYLLIGFWYERPAASRAAFKAFLVNRVGDLGLILAILLIFWNCNSLNFDNILTNVDHTPSLYINLISVFLLLAAMGKSAQLGLHVWLADAMEGPTPVSALIHAATMVTAGVFLLIRCAALLEYSPLTKDLMIYVGILTAVFAATTAITQNDIKRIIAFSTCSQLGLMVMSCGCSAYMVAFFHLFTHAFFKALLFLSAGAVIHAMSDHQNIQKMGGIWRLIPITYSTMWIGSLALSGIPYFAGYYSKELVLNSAYALGGVKGCLVYYTGCIVTILTAFYSWRLIFLVFHGPSNANERVAAHVHEAPKTMIYPMIILSIMAIISGYIGNKWFIEEKWLFSWKGIVPYNKHYNDHLFLPLLAGILGIFIATCLYFRKTNILEQLALRLKIIYNFLLNSWYIDTIYQVIFVKPVIRMAEILDYNIDQQIINRFGPDGVASLCIRLSQKLRNIQTGYLYHYALMMITGLALLLLGYILLPH